MTDLGSPGYFHTLSNQDRAAAAAGPGATLASHNRNNDGRLQPQAQRPPHHQLMQPQHQPPQHQSPPPQQQQQQQQQKVVLIEAPKQPLPFKKRYFETNDVIGVLEIVVGLFSISLGIANPLTCGYYGFIGYGIWCGTLYVIAGGVSIMTRRRTHFLIIAHLTMSNLTAMFAGVQFCLAVIAAAKDNDPLFYSLCLYKANFSLPDQPVNDSRGRVTVDALLAFAAVVAAVAGVLSSGLTCKGLCFPPRHSSSPGISSGSVHCVPGHMVCSSHPNQISAGTRAIINGVITFQGQGQD